MANFTEQNLTAEVLRTFANTPNKRLKFIIEETVKSLHDLVRRTDLTFEEWNQAIDFLTRTGQTCTPLRQEFILLSDVLGVSMLVDAVNHREREGATETTVLGPFYVGEHRVTPHGADISEGVDGEPMFVQSRVIDLAGRPLAGAEIDVWHADDDGFYDSQKPDYASHGPSLRARFIADADGRFSFRTILPCSYPIPTDGPVGNLIATTKRHPMRPAHVHFLVKAEGYEPLITHVFLDGDEYLRSDVVFGVKDELIARVEPKSEPVLPNGEQVSGRWHLMSYDFQMKPGAGLVPQPMIASEQHGGTMATPTRIAPIGEAPAATISPGVRIGHVHLKVADIDRALAFYCGMLGFELMQQIGPKAAFVSAGGYHHHIGLNTWESRGGAPPAPGTTGLHHLAVLYPTRAELGAALRRLIEADIPLDGASDHGVSEALYLRDPDDNGVELYWDRPKELWPLTADGKLAMFTRRLDLMNLLAEADTAPGAPVDVPLFEPSRGA